MAPKKRAPIIIITGGTGSGKSTVAAVFRKLGARLIDVDRFAHRLLKPGGQSWHEILWEFCGVKMRNAKHLGSHYAPEDFIDAQGRSLPELPWVITPAGTIRRDLLGATVFANAKALETLNKIMHPRLRKALDAKIKMHRKLSTKPLVLDMAVYPARPFRSMGDLVLWVRAPGGLRVQRLADSKRLTMEEASARVHLQWKDEEYKKVADVVLPNLGSDTDIQKGAQELWQRLLSQASGSR
ncbi:dephospho-CoA kinase [candidate division FCPU426 bacterium]|nr:dephospho-CoA kinase [candidate division FCPU426 bacterium]